MENTFEKVLTAVLVTFGLLVLRYATPVVTGAAAEPPLAEAAVPMGSLKP